MSVLVLSEHDVRELLDMESCIAAMEDVLARLARGELTNPLRSLCCRRAPDGDGLDARPTRAVTTPVFALKEIVVVGANSARGLDPHQGSVLLHDGDDRTAARGPQRLADHRDPHGGRLRRGDDACWRDPARAPSPCSAPASRDARTSTRCRPCSTIRSSGSGAGTRARRGARARDALARRGLGRGGGDGADIVCTATSAARADRRARLAGARDARQRRRGVLRTGVARARPRTSSPRPRALRRPARVDAERVG